MASSHGSSSPSLGRSLASIVVDLASGTQSDFQFAPLEPAASVAPDSPVDAPEDVVVPEAVATVDEIKIHELHTPGEEPTPASPASDESSESDHQDETETSVSDTVVTGDLDAPSEASGDAPEHDESSLILDNPDESVETTMGDATDEATEDLHGTANNDLASEEAASDESATGEDTVAVEETPQAVEELETPEEAERKAREAAEVAAMAQTMEVVPDPLDDERAAGTVTENTGDTDTAVPDFDNVAVVAEFNEPEAAPAMEVVIAPQPETENVFPATMDDAPVRRPTRPEPPVVEEERKPRRPRLFGRGDKKNDAKASGPKRPGRNDVQGSDNSTDTPRDLTGAEAVVDAFPKKEFSADGMFTSVATSAPLPERDEHLEGLASAATATDDAVDLSGFDPSKYLGTSMERIASGAAPEPARTQMAPLPPRPVPASAGTPAPGSGPARPASAETKAQPNKDSRAVMQMLHELSQLKNTQNPSS